MKNFTCIFVFIFSVVFAKVLFGRKTATNGENLLQNQLAQNSISFRENKGQVSDQNYDPRSDVLFSGNNKDMVYHLRKNGISYQFSRVDTWKEKEDLMQFPGRDEPKRKVPDLISIYRLDLTWLAANPIPVTEPGEALAGYDNFYLAACPDGALGIKTYKAVTYKNLYPGIDLKFYEKNRQLKYDYIISPGADYRQIKIKVEGAESIEENSNGEIEIKTPLGNLSEGKPLVFQEGKPLDAKWKIDGDTLSFEIIGIDTTKPLLIDPLIRNWGTYYGGSLYDKGFAANTDYSGNILMSGVTESINNIATSGSHQSIFGGNTDAFLVKFNINGVRQWGTYYGGINDDDVGICSSDVLGNCYLCGRTVSTTVIATTGSYQSGYGGGISDAFLVKFNGNGTRLWGTYYGGSGWEVGYSMAIEKGNIYISGITDSQNLIATPGSHQSTFGGGLKDAFLVKFDTSGSRLWGTYYGGIDWENGYFPNGLFLDDSANVFLTGGTASQSSIATNGSHQNIFGGGQDLFLVKFDADGIRQWATYYGGNDGELGAGGFADDSCNVYLSGITASTSGIATPGSHQSIYGGGLRDAFLVKFNGSGVRQWATYYGGNDDDQAWGCAIDTFQNIYIAGGTLSQANIASNGSYQSSIGGGYDGFLVKFNSNGLRQWATYYGDSGDDAALCVLDNINGKIYLAGLTTSSTSIATTGGHQNFYAGNNDAFLVQFEENCLFTIDAENVSVCRGDSVIIGGSPTVSGSSSPYIYLWNPSTGLNATDVPNPIATPDSTTEYTLVVNDSDYCFKSKKIIVTVIDKSIPVITANDSTSFCEGDSVLLDAGANYANYLWNTGDTTQTIAVKSTGNYSVNVIDTNGCSNDSTVTISVIVNPLPNPDITASDSFICPGKTITLFASGGTGYLWNTGDTTAAINVNPPNDVYYYLTAFNQNCIGKDSILITVLPLPGSEIISPESITIFLGEDTMLNASVPANATISWSPSDFLSCTDCINPIANPDKTITYYLTVTSSNGCSITDSVMVIIENRENNFFVPSMFSPNGDGNNDIFRVRGNNITEGYIAVYNRWGEKIYELEFTGNDLNDMSKWWNGTYKGKSLNTGVFVYFANVSFTDGTVEEKKGNITLIR